MLDLLFIFFYDPPQGFFRWLLQTTSTLWNMWLKLKLVAILRTNLKNWKQVNKKQNKFDSRFQLGLFYNPATLQKDRDPHQVTNKETKTQMDSSQNLWDTKNPA